MDCDSISFEKAFHDDHKGLLHFSICDGDKTKTNQTTSIEVINLPDANNISVKCDGTEFKDYQLIDGSKISINTEVRKHNFEIETKFYLSNKDKTNFNKKLKEVQNLKHPKTRHASSNSSRLILPTNLNSCSCC